MKKAGYSLRPATDQDIEFLYNLEREGMKPYVIATWGDWDEEHFSKYHAEKMETAQYEIVVVDGLDAGALHLIDKDTEITIKQIFVAPEFRNKGLGTAVLRDVIRKSEQRRKTLALRVLKVNPAQQLYLKLGFVIVDQDNEFFYMHREFNLRSKLNR